MPTPSRETRKTLDNTTVPLRAFQIVYKSFTELQKEHNALRLSNALPKREEENVPMPQASNSDPQPAPRKEDDVPQTLDDSDGRLQLKRREEELARREAAVYRKEMDLVRREAKVGMARREAMVARKALEWSRHTGKIWMSRISQLYNEVDETGKALDSILADDEMNIIGPNETLEGPPNLEGRQHQNRPMTPESSGHIFTSPPLDKWTRLPSKIEIQLPSQVVEGSSAAGNVHHIAPPKSIPSPKRKIPSLDHINAPLARGRKLPKVVPFVELHRRTKSNRGKGRMVVHFSERRPKKSGAHGRKVPPKWRSGSPAV